MSRPGRVIKVSWDGQLQISEGDEVEILRGIVNESRIRASVLMNHTRGRRERSDIEGVLMTRGPSDLKPPMRGVAKNIEATRSSTSFDLVESIGIVEEIMRQVSREARSFLDPVIVERCLGQRHAEDVITNGFRVLEERIRAKIGVGPEMHGADLITEAFHPQRGKLMFGKTEAEREGLYNLYRGAMLFLRNPPSHRFINEYNDADIFEITCFVDLLLKLIEKCRLR